MEYSREEDELDQVQEEPDGNGPLSRRLEGLAVEQQKRTALSPSGHNLSPLSLEPAHINITFPPRDQQPLTPVTPTVVMAHTD